MSGLSPGTLDRAQRNDSRDFRSQKQLKDADFSYSRASVCVYNCKYMTTVGNILCYRANIQTAITIIDLVNTVDRTVQSLQTLTTLPKHSDHFEHRHRHTQRQTAGQPCSLRHPYGWVFCLCLAPLGEAEKINEDVQWTDTTLHTCTLPHIVLFQPCHVGLDLGKCLVEVMVEC